MNMLLNHVIKWKEIIKSQFLDTCDLLFIIKKECNSSRSTMSMTFSVGSKENPILYLREASGIIVSAKTCQKSVSYTFYTSKSVALRNWVTLEIDSRYKNKNIGFYPKSLRPFLGILCVADDYAREMSVLHILSEKPSRTF